MGTIELDRQDVEAHIMRGNAQHGQYILAVAPDGSRHMIVWANHTRSWDDYPDDWYTTALPSVHPDGSGRAREDAEDTIYHVLGRAAWEDARRRRQEDGPSWVALVHELCPEAWQDTLTDQATELAYQWICGLNGEPSDLDMTAPWGSTWTEDGHWEPIVCPHRFAWAPA